MSEMRGEHAAKLLFGTASDFLRLVEIVQGFGGDEVQDVFMHVAAEGNELADRRLANGNSDTAGYGVEEGAVRWLSSFLLEHLTRAHGKHPTDVVSKVYDAYPALLDPGRRELSGLALDQYVIAETTQGAGRE